MVVGIHFALIFSVLGRRETNLVSHVQYIIVKYIHSIWSKVSSRLLGDFHQLMMHCTTNSSNTFFLCSKFVIFQP